MITISLTDFVDFAVKAGTPKLTKVRQVKNRPEYSPATDFWKPLRTAIAEYHRAGETDRGRFDGYLEHITDQKKLTRYPDAIRAYKKFLGRKALDWVEPWSGTWGPAGISIRVNPELGLLIDGQPHLIKLYFKAEPLAQRRIDILLLLMHQALHRRAADGTRYALLDVERGKLYATADPDRELLPLLTGEAMSFMTIWNEI